MDFLNLHVEILMANFSPKFKFKICQKFKVNQPKEINCYVLDDFCMANFIFLTDFKFKIRWETRSKSLNLVRKTNRGNDKVQHSKTSLMNNVISYMKKLSLAIAWLRISKKYTSLNIKDTLNCCKILSVIRGHWNFTVFLDFVFEGLSMNWVVDFCIEFLNFYSVSTYYLFDGI